MKEHVFLDSGAFTLNMKMNQAAKKGQSSKDFYKSKVFWDYVDAYGKFVRKYKKQFDFYANVDTSNFPKITWKVQKYLENEYGLHPLPVIHHGEDLKWLEKYLEAGYDFICIGGVAKNKSFSFPGKFTSWGDKAFKIICPQENDFLPTIKVHGFGMSDIRTMTRYPWYSVDSVTWKKMSYYGQILVPRKYRGKWDFKTNPIVLFVDPQSKYTVRDGNSGRHFLFLSDSAQKTVLEWLDLIDVPFGKSKSDGSIEIPGVTNEALYRCQATIRYFREMVKTLPTWPWSFDVQERPTLWECL